MLLNFKLQELITVNCERKPFTLSLHQQQQLKYIFHENLPAHPELTGVSLGKRVCLLLSIFRSSEETLMGISMQAAK